MLAIQKYHQLSTNTNIKFTTKKLINYQKKPINLFYFNFSTASFILISIFLITFTQSISFFYIPTIFILSI
jgi:hypothetical protein